MVRLAERSAPESIDGAHVARLKPEEDNIRAALEWSVQHNAAELGLRLATGACFMWVFNGHNLEGSQWVERLLGLSSASSNSGARATASLFQAEMLLNLGNYALAQERAEAGLEEHRARGDTRGVGLGYHMLGNVALHRGLLAEANTLHTSAAQQWRSVNSPGYALSLGQCGIEACELGDFERVGELAVELDAIGRAQNEPLIQADELHLKGTVAAAEGDSNATALFNESIELRLGVWDVQGIVMTLTSLGHAEMDLNRTTSALQTLLMPHVTPARRASWYE
jgi:hypothetical protein